MNTTNYSQHTSLFATERGASTKDGPVHNNFRSQHSLKFACALLASALILMMVPTPSLAGVVYGLKSLVASPSSAPTSLFSFQTNGSSLVNHGFVSPQFGGGLIDADGLAYSPIFGLVAFEVGPGSSMISLSITASGVVASQPGFFLNRDIRGATFDQAHNLWALDAAANQVLRINPVSGSEIPFSAVGLTHNNAPFNLSDASDIAVRNDGTFFVSSATTIYTLNPLTGVLSQSFVDPAEGLAGLAFDSDPGAPALFSYDGNGPEDIHRYSSTTPFPAAHTTPYPNIVPSYNAGRGDLASWVSIPEPSTMVIFGVGLIGVSCSRRRS